MCSKSTPWLLRRVFIVPERNSAALSKRISSGTPTSLKNSSTHFGALALSAVVKTTSMPVNSSTMSSMCRSPLRPVGNGPAKSMCTRCSLRVAGLVVSRGNGRASALPREHGSQRSGVSPVAADDGRG